MRRLTIDPPPKTSWRRFRWLEPITIWVICSCRANSIKVVTVSSRSSWCQVAPTSTASWRSCSSDALSAGGGDPGLFTWEAGGSGLVPGGADVDRELAKLLERRAVGGVRSSRTVHVDDVEIGFDARRHP